MSDLTVETIYQNKFIEDSSINIIVIGAGGTGGYLVPNLARILSIKNKQRQVQGLRKHTLTLVDADGVEQKNLSRQNFTTNDIGKNKAEVLASRYSRAFGLDIDFVPEYIQAEGDLYEIMETVCQKRYHNSDNRPFGNSVYNLVVIDCVDNIKTRYIIKKAINLASDNLSLREIVYISSGNEERAGQVVTSFKSTDSYRDELDEEVNEDGLQLFCYCLSRTPDVIEIFQNSMKPRDKMPGEMSCAEHAVSAPQDIAANIFASNYIFGVMNKIINYEPVSELMIMFDTRNLNSKTYFNKMSDLEKVLTIEGDKNPFELEFYSNQYILEKYGSKEKAKMLREFNNRKKEIADIKLEVRKDEEDESELQDTPDLRPF